VISRETELSPTWQFLSVKLAELRLDRASKNTLFNAESREVRNADKVLKTGDDLIKDAPVQVEKGKQMGVNDVHQSLRATLLNKTSERQATAAELETLKTQLKQYQTELREINDRHYRIKALDRQRESVESIYNIYLKDAEAVRLGDERDRAKLANLVIVQHAGLPLSPKRPRKLLYIGLALAGGLLLGLAWAFVREMTDTSYWNPNDLSDDIGLPVLGTLDQI
jgi:polysaccharide biosynthesis transport protein